MTCARSMPGSPRSNPVASFSALSWLLDTPSMDCLSRSPNELFSAPAASPTPRMAGISLCAVMRRIWSRRLLTSMVVMTVFQRVIGLLTLDARAMPTERDPRSGRSAHLRGLGQTVLTQLLDERRALHAKQLGRMGDHAVRRVQCLADQTNLDTGKVILEIEPTQREHCRIAFTEAEDLGHRFRLGFHHGDQSGAGDFFHRQ